MKTILICIAILYQFTNNTCKAQNELLAHLKDEGAFTVQKQIKIIKNLEKIRNIDFPKKEQNRSSFSYYLDVDSCLKANDSIAASEYFLLTDPYHTKTILEKNKITLDSLLVYLKITQEVVKLYKSNFIELKESSLYNILKGYYFKIENLQKTRDSVSGMYKDDIVKLMIEADSTHFDFIRKYIKENGWPTLKDGAIYAVDIVKRDLEHFYFYIPYLKNAILKNMVSRRDAYKVYENHQYYFEYMRVKESTLNEHIKYDVSEFKYFVRRKFLESPKIYNNIISDVKDYCPVEDFMFVFYAKKPKSSQQSFGNAVKENKTECHDLIRDFLIQCPNFKKNSGKMIVCKHIYLPNYYYGSDREFLYIIK